MRHVSRCLLLFLFLCATSSLSFGWGCSGHQIVALLAQKQLTASARQAVLDLLGGSPIDASVKRFCGQTTLGPMADVSTWADDYREKESSTGNWHFWDISLNVKEEPEPTEFCDPLCVNRAIQKQLTILRSGTAAREDKIKALMFVIHLMGDMHQPLHTISNNDRGGNCVPVNFFEQQTKEGDHASYFPNLHGVWDTSILERVANIRRETHDADVKHFANTLALRYGPQIAKWKVAPIDVSGWGWESHEVASKIVYGKLPAAITPEDPVKVSSCADDNNIGHRMLDLHESINQQYVTAATPVIEKQLAKAGARLADVLNQAFAPRPKGPAGTAQDNPISRGLPIQLQLSGLKPGAVITVSGIKYINGFDPSLATLQAQGVKDVEFGTTTMTISMQDPMPGNGTINMTVYTEIYGIPVFMSFEPAGAATLTITPPHFYNSKPVSTTGPNVSLGFPSPLPGCSFQGCSPSRDCIDPVCDCEQDKKKQIFNCCP